MSHGGRQPGRRVRPALLCIVVGVAALATILVAVWPDPPPPPGALSPSDAEAGAGRPRDARLAAGAGVSAGTPHVCRFDVGEERAWALDLRVAFRRPQADGLPGAPPAPRTGRTVAPPEPSETALSGTLRARAVTGAGGGADGDGAQLLVRLTPTVAGEALRGLDTPFLATLGRDCAFGEFGFPPGTSPEVRNLLTSLLLSLEVALPPKGLPSQWVRRQADGTGTFTAFYRLLDETGLRVERTRREYERLWLAERGQAPDLVVLSSRLEAELDPQGRWLENAAGRDTVAVAVSSGGAATGAGGPITVDSRVRISRLPAVPGEGLPDLDPASAEWRPAAAAPLPVRAGALAAAGAPVTALIGVPFAEMLPALVEARRSDPTMGVARMAEALAAWLRANPDGAQEVIAAIASGRLPEDLRAPAFLGLETAGTPEAHDALVDAVFRSDLDEIDRVRAVAALPDVPAPTAETAEALAAAAQSAGSSEPDDVANSAMLALGVLEANTRETNGEVAALAREAIVARLADGEDEVALRMAFRAVGNSGNAELLERVLPYLEDERLAVRAGALTALRGLPLEETADLFGALFAAAEQGDLRREIASVFTEQARMAGVPPDPVVLAEAIAALASEPEVEVRAALIELVGLAVGTDRAAREALVDHFHRETSQRLLALVGRFLPAEELL